MNDQQRTNSISSGVVAAISAAVVAVSGSVAWFSAQTPDTPTPTNSSQTIKQPVTQQGNEHGDTESYPNCCNKCLFPACQQK